MDSSHMISQATSERIKMKLEDMPELLKDFQRFIKLEPYCGEAVRAKLDELTKVIMSGLEIPCDEEGTGISVDDAMYVAENYMNVNMLMIQAFSAGMSCGRARFDDNFMQNFKNNYVRKAIDDII